MVIALESGSSGLGSSLAGEIVLCSWKRHSTHTVPLGVGMRVNKNSFVKVNKNSFPGCLSTVFVIFNRSRGGVVA